MNGKTVLITGGTGTWATALIRLLLDSGVGELRVCARGESGITALQRSCQDSRLICSIGDIRDRQRLMTLCKGVDVVFHLAALKHVPICEAMPYEAVMTNVYGTQNVIDCGVACGVEKVIYASTDKAVAPSCTYGSTKLLGEKMILAANGGATRFMVFRSGNLLGSSGSVIPLFQGQIAQRGRVTLTHQSMNRFFITVERAAALLVRAAQRGAGGEVFIPTMPSLRIYDIARYLLEQSGVGVEGIELCGLRPGERLNEAIATPDEAQSICRLDEELDVLCGEDRHGWIANGFVQRRSEYRCGSQDAVVSYEEAKQFLQRAGVTGGIAI